MSMKGAAHCDICRKMEQKYAEGAAHRNKRVTVRCTLFNCLFKRLQIFRCAAPFELTTHYSVLITPYSLLRTHYFYTALQYGTPFLFS
jgi:hypothetical protein